MTCFNTARAETGAVDKVAVHSPSYLFPMVLDRGSCLGDDGFFDIEPFCLASHGTLKGFNKIGFFGRHIALQKRKAPSPERTSGAMLGGIRSAYQGMGTL